MRNMLHFGKRSAGLVDVSAGAGREPHQADWWRAVAAPRSVVTVDMIASKGEAFERTTFSPDEQRHPARRPVARANRWPAACDGLARYAASRFGSRSWQCFDELIAREARDRSTASSLFGSMKIDTVVIRGVNDDELVDLGIEYGRTVNGEVRFIEQYMDVGGATLVARHRGLTTRDARTPRRALRADRRSRPGRLGSRRSLSPERRHRLRHHLVDDRAVPASTAIAAVSPQTA